MSKQLISKILKEALGVPSNIHNVAKGVFESFINEVKTNISDDSELCNSTFNLNFGGDYHISDYQINSFNIRLTIKCIEEFDKVNLVSMSYHSPSKIDYDKLKIINLGSDGNINLSINIAITPTTSKNELIQQLILSKNKYITSIAHELKHSYDAFKKPYDSLEGRAMYSTNTSLRFGIKPLDEFTFFLYYTHAAENLVRPTEIATQIDLGNISKSKFVQFLVDNETYQKLKRINNFSYVGLKSELLDYVGDIKALFERSGIEIPNNDEELITKLLYLYYRNFYQTSVDKLGDILMSPSHDFMVFMSKGLLDKYMDEYVKKISKVKNADEFFEINEKMFKFVSSKLIKKIHKLYDMAKDDKNLNALMTKINSKEQTNESIHDWDLYHKINKTPAPNLGKIGDDYEYKK
jgi:hypothetical protein